MPNSQDVGCPMCPAAAATDVATPIARHSVTDETWQLFECRRCALQYWFPREIDSSFYAEAHQGTYDRRRSGESFLRERHHVFLRRAHPGRLLDIGCGEGGFLESARDLGYIVAGVDLDPGNIAVAQSRNLENVACGLAFDSNGELPSNLRALPPFDWITAFEVLEHQADPAAFLRLVRSKLAAGGRMCGSVPNRDRIFAKQNRKRSNGDYPPHHFLWFSESALAATLRTAGFQNVHVAAIPEQNTLKFASYLEQSLFGSLTGAGKARARAMNKRTSSSPFKRIVKSVKLAKNMPFAPLALAVQWALPGQTRALYFEAW